jgi:hypothetical protein
MGTAALAITPLLWRSAAVRRRLCVHAAHARPIQQRLHFANLHPGGMETAAQMYNHLRCGTHHYTTFFLALRLRRLMTTTAHPVKLHIEAVNEGALQVELLHLCQTAKLHANSVAAANSEGMEEGTFSTSNPLL